MPYLDISGRDDEKDLLELQRVMLFPNDEELRSQLYWMQEARKIVVDDCFEISLQDELNGLLKANLVKKLIRNLLFCPSIDEMKKKYERALDYGLISAMFLINFYKLYNQGDSVSLNIAEHSTKKILRGTELPIGDIRKTLRQYADSSHITAAFILWPFQTNPLADILACAEQFRKFGEGINLDNRSKPLLNPETTWKVPLEYPLSAVEIMRPPSDESLAASAREYLDGQMWAKNRGK